MTGIRRMARIIFPAALLILLLIFPQASATGVAEGLRIAALSALPALFPALVLSKLLSTAPLSGGRFLPLVLGLTCGFPVGAITVCDMKESGRLTRDQANRLLFCCNNTGPAFLVGFAGVSVLGSARAGWLLYGAECAVALFLFFLLSRPAPSIASRANPIPLFQAIRSAAETFLTLAGCILFFSFLTSLLFALFSGLFPEVKSCIALFFEITGGLSSLRALPLFLAFPLCAVGVGWAGLSVHLQTAGQIRRAGLSFAWYLAGKATMAILMLPLALFLKKLL